MADVLISVTYVDAEGSERTFETSFEWAPPEGGAYGAPRAPFAGLKRKVTDAARDVATDLILELAKEARES